MRHYQLSWVVAIPQAADVVPDDKRQHGLRKKSACVLQFVVGEGLAPLAPWGPATKNSQGWPVAAPMEAILVFYPVSLCAHIAQTIITCNASMWATIHPCTPAGLRRPRITDNVSRHRIKNKCSHLTFSAHPIHAWRSLHQQVVAHLRQTWVEM